MDFLSFAQQSFEHFYAYIVATSFASARMTGLIVIMPAFTRIGLTRLQQAATALALALPLVPMIVAGIAREQLTPMIIAFLLFKEVLIGLVIGVVLGVPIWAAETAGDVLDLQRGSTAASIFDPSSAGEEGITGTLFGLIMVALYFGSGGLALALHTVYESYALWPVSSILPALTVTAAEFFVRLLDSILTMGLVLVVPIVIFMLLTDLTLALVSRAAPQLNVFTLSLSVKNFVFSLLLVLYGAFLIAYMRNDLGSLLRAGSELETLAKPSVQ